MSDITQAMPLQEGLKAQAVLADKGYDADDLIDRIQASGADGSHSAQAKSGLYAQL